MERPDLFLEIKSYPDDPYLVVAHGYPYFSDGDMLGWEGVTERERLQTILSLGPDILDSHHLQWANGEKIILPRPVNNELDFSFSNDLPATSGQTIYLTTEGSTASRKYGWLERQKKWKYPDGSDLKSMSGLIAEKFNGSRWTMGVQGKETGIPSIFAPATFDIQTFEAKEILEAGFSGMFIDSVTSPRLDGLDFSQWATEAFRKHLSELSAEEIEQLGIENTDTFNIKDYLQSSGLAPSEGVDPRSDPVFREYTLFHHRGVKQFYEDYQSFLQEKFPERKDTGKAVLYGNQFIGKDMWGIAPAVYLSDVFDLVTAEDTRTLPPKTIRDVIYKLLLASGRYEKSVLVEGQMQQIKGTNSSQGLDLTKEYPTLQRLQIAEAYAMGTVRKLPLTGWANVHESNTVTHWIEPDGSVPKELKAFSDFLQANRQVLNPTEPANDIALVFSLPTRIWSRFPQWGIWPDKHVESFRGAARALQQAQQPYDVQIFGHPDLYPDGDQLDQLAAYDTVILPGIDCLTEEQGKTLEEFVKDDNNLLVSGSPPKRDQNYQVNSEIRSVFDNQDIEFLENNPARAAFNNRSRRKELIAQIEEGMVTVEADGSVGVNLLQHTNQSIFQVHVLNYSYDADNDRVSLKTDIPVKIDTEKIPWDINAAQYRTPTGQESIKIEKNADSISFTLPELQEWGFVLLGPSSSEWESQVSEKQAQNAINRAESAIHSAQSESRDWSTSFTKAKISLDLATTFAEWDTFKQAEEAAKRSQKLAKSSYSRPKVGIDQAHGQPTSQVKDEPFTHLDSSLGQYSYQIISDWEEIDISELDILLIPPAVKFKVNEYGFSSGELDQIERFVKNGGSLGIFARGEVATDISALVNRFGFEYRGPSVLAPNKRPIKVSPSHRFHELTQGIDHVDGKLGTPIEKMPDNATVLIEYPEDPEIWIHERNPFYSRNESEPTGAGKPLYAIAPYNNGLVAVSGIHYPLVNSHSGPSAVKFMKNLLEVFGSKSKQTISTDPSTASTGSEGDSPNSSPEQTESSAPGFGFQTTAVGLGFAAIIGKMVSGLKNRYEK